ncbi:Isoleucine--tRNA ligase, chloroplastic/mitochondrial [Ancistrocladus abbreviatus]
MFECGLQPAVRVPNRLNRRLSHRRQIIHAFPTTPKIIFCPLSTGTPLYPTFTLNHSLPNTYYCFSVAAPMTALHNSSYKVLSQRNCWNLRGATCVSLFSFRRSSSIKIYPLANTLCYCNYSSGDYLPSSKRRSRGPLMAAKKASEGTKQEDGKYKDTVNLPKTMFGMRANSLVKEPEIQKLWEDNQVFKKVVDRNDGGTFILHDGPPYANGDLHIGHALNKILKDIINRYKLLQNLKVHYVPGWDCHGLPIELKGKS